VYVDANSNLSHQGERLYTGDFGATLRNALPSAVGAPEGQRMRITGLENLKPKNATPTIGKAIIDSDEKKPTSP
ncbi:MAG: hypothetical protein WB662_15815, partial [Methyloceanibacter sp.]